MCPVSSFECNLSEAVVRYSGKNASQISERFSLLGYPTSITTTDGGDLHAQIVINNDQKDPYFLAKVSSIVSELDGDLPTIRSPYKPHLRI